MFRLLKLKPPHGWNAVVWELAIITLGVLIALAAQQVVSDLNDRRIAAETRREVTDELNSEQARHDAAVALGVDGIILHRARSAV